MHPETALLFTIAGAFGSAFLFGFIASKLKMPPLVGYLLAGIALGPHSPGFIGNVGLASQLAEIGVILLMFGVGLHFSPGDLMRVRRIALPGATLQMLTAIGLGYWLASSWGWTPAAALVFGLSLSVASTVVVLRVLEDRGLMDSIDGRVAVGWLVVEDVLVVLALVLLPAILNALGAGGDGAAPMGRTELITTVSLTLVKMAAFIVLMGVVGRRAVPWLLTHVVRSGSRELFTLAVLAVSLGVAVGAATLFGVSFALGAFVAGVVISESELSHRAGADALPMQDAFAVLFFVSVGMLLDPTVMMTQPLKVLATVAIVLLGNTVVATVLMVLLRHPFGASLRIGASFGQIGEFSFILAGLGVSLGVLSEEGRSLILAAALCTIVLNPLLFASLDRLSAWIARHPRVLDRLERQKAPRMAHTALFETVQQGHAILIGYGRVGRTIGDALQRLDIPFVAIEQDRRVVDAMRTIGVASIFGDATRADVLEHAHPAGARLLVVASPDPYHARHIIDMVRAKNPTIDVVVRTHSDQEQAMFEQLGVSKALMGERELAFGMAYHSLRSLGIDDDRADDIVEGLRDGGRMQTREFSALMPTAPRM
ncbi:cation:proton antiporter [Gemmatimonas sp.]|jgi:CPA2 family monovalent cation:H+ antiporter-2|uniref:cation:proton antiporter domain-containing protein n=1 Tax=Gemmatimonas sp. TaxID=1962908 RepID=UPI0037BE7B73